MAQQRDYNAERMRNLAQDPNQLMRRGQAIWAQKQGGQNVAQTDPYQLPQQNKNTLAAQGPYQMPGGQGPISTYPGQQGPTGGQWGQPSAGPRPRPQQPNMLGPRTNFAPGQQPYTGPAIVPLQGYKPGMGIGPGGPTRYVGPYGQQGNQGTGQPPWQGWQNQPTFG